MKTGPHIRCHVRSPLAICIAACFAVFAPSANAQSTDWTHLAGGPQRLATAGSEFPSLSGVLWTQTLDPAGNTIEFTPQTGVVGAGGKVYITGTISPPMGPANQPRLFCFDALNGTPLWAAPVGAVAGESFATPCIDVRNGTILHGSNRSLVAYDMVTGVVRWSRQLTRTIVNASPLVTDDRGSRNRCFITDYDGLGSSAKLYCINIDPFNAALNPYLPGQIVWSAPIQGASGNSPAYIPNSKGGTGLIYVSSVGSYLAGTPGAVYAFAIDSVGTPSPAWVAPSPDLNGFFGGVSATGSDNDDGGAIFAATYNFFGGLDSATLVKLDATSGELLWSTPCNRTSSIPIPLSCHRVLLSSGFSGAGSALSLELFEDEGDHAHRLWNTADSTWIDADGDGTRDPDEYIAVGGYSVQPAVRISGHSVKVLCGVGSISELTTEPSNGLFVLDLDQTPSEPEFFEQFATGAGSTPAVVGGLIYSVGVAGLRAFGTVPPAYDVDEDGWVTIGDLYAWEQGRGRRDVDQNGTATAGDRALLISELRKQERVDLGVTR